MNSNEFDNTGYGAIIEVSSNLKKFIHYSEKSFRWFIEETYRNPSVLLTNNNSIFNNICCIAKNTSYSIRLLSSWGQPIEAYMLLRIRLDQLINCSYLIYEDPDLGINSYMNYYPKFHKRILNSLENDLLLKKSLQNIFPKLFENLDEKIAFVDEYIRQKIDNDTSLPKDNWTKFNVRDRARERDKYVLNTDDISKNSLEELYINIFKVSSSVVHSDASAISNNFYTVNPNGILIPQMHYIFISLIQNALMDIIECHELSRKFKFNIGQKYYDLYNAFLKDVKSIKL